MIQKRGQLTERIKQKSLELLGYEINQTELRLMVYIQYTLVNFKDVDLNKIDPEEFSILRDWCNKGYMTFIIPPGRITVTKKFWDILCEIIYLGYVDLSSREAE